MVNETIVRLPVIACRQSCEKLLVVNISPEGMFLEEIIFSRDEVKWYLSTQIFNFIVYNQRGNRLEKVSY